MKIYKKLALVVACLAASEIMPAEKSAPAKELPAPDTSTTEPANDSLLAALELASMLQHVPQNEKTAGKNAFKKWETFAKERHKTKEETFNTNKKTLEQLLSLNDNGETIFPLDLSNKKKAFELLHKIPDNTKLNLNSGRKITLLKSVRESMINDLKKEMEEQAATTIQKAYRNTNALNKIKQNVYYNQKTNNITLRNNANVEEIKNLLNSLPKGIGIKLESDNQLDSKYFKALDILLAIETNEEEDDLK